MSSMWRACHSSSRRFLSPSLGSTESSEWSVPLRRDRTAGRHSEGFWPQCDTVLRSGVRLGKVPIVHPTCRVVESMSEVRDETAPNCTERPELAPNDRSGRLSLHRSHLPWFLTNWSRWSRKTLIGAQFDETETSMDSIYVQRVESGLNPI